MFNGKVKFERKNGRIYGKAVFPGPAGKVMVAAKETIIGSDIGSAVAKVMNQITEMAEFFPLEDLIGEASFAKAIRLFGTLKKGSQTQKAQAVKEINVIKQNAHRRMDPTAQDIEYALGRFARAEKEYKIDVSGDSTIDAFGFSPAKLRSNLNKLALTNPAIKNAQTLFNMLRSNDKNKVSLAVNRIREIYKELQRDNVSGESTSNRVTLIGLGQIMKAEKCSLAKKQMFGRDDVTLGFSLKKAIKKVARKTGSVAKKVAPYAAVATFGPAALASKKVRRGIGIQKKAKPTPKQSTALVVQKPAAVKSESGRPLGSPSMSLMTRASQGEPQAIAKIQAINSLAKDGNPQAQAAMQNLQAADSSNQEYYEEYYDEEPGDEMVEEIYEEAPEGYAYADDEGLTDQTEDIVGYKFSLKPGKKMKSAMSVAKPIMKKLVPLAAKAADSYAPGSGVAVSAILPSVIDAIPSDRQKDLTMSKLAKGMDMVKAASEMDPKAMMDIENIKKLAGEGVPAAVTSLDALKVAKTIQKVTEGTAAAVLQDRKGVNPFNPKDRKAAPKMNSGDVVNVRIVEWGPK